MQDSNYVWKVININLLNLFEQMSVLQAEIRSRKQELKYK